MNEKQIETLQKKTNIERELKTVINIIDNFITYQISQIPKLLEEIKTSVIKVKEGINEIANEVLKNGK